VLDLMLKLEGPALWIDMIPSEQRDTLRAAVEKALNDWWENAPQDHKNQLNDMIASSGSPQSRREGVGRYQSMVDSAKQ
jgi:hypothetical protein